MNNETSMTLTEAVGEVLLILTGQDLHYDSQYDRFRAVTHSINRALRLNALELEWSYYSELLQIGPAQDGVQTYTITSDYRFRVINDDAVRLLNSDGIPVAWAYFLPRDALHKYHNRNGLWASVTRDQLSFSQPLNLHPDQELTIEVPVMREPRMFRLPPAPFEVEQGLAGDAPVIYPDVLEETVDFHLPDLITARAAYIYAQTDPVMQPRAQTLEESAKDLMYQAMERDQAFTDTPYQNEIIVPVQGTIYDESLNRPWPVANRR